jgi:hypothetical protein
MSNDAILRGNNVIKYKPEQSVTTLAVGDRIQLPRRLRPPRRGFFADLGPSSTRWPEEASSSPSPGRRQDAAAVGRALDGIAAGTP